MGRPSQSELTIVGSARLIIDPKTFLGIEGGLFERWRLFFERWRHGKKICVTCRPLRSLKDQVKDTQEDTPKTQLCAFTRAVLLCLALKLNDCPSVHVPEDGRAEKPFGSPPLAPPLSFMPHLQGTKGTR